MEDSILLKVIGLSCIGSALLLYVAISFFFGVNAFNNEKIKTNSIIIKIFATKVLPIGFIGLALWFSGLPIVDYTMKDYQTNIGTLKDISGSYKNFVTKRVKIVGDKNTYYIPIGSVRALNEGTKYEFIYGKRSNVIIKMKEINE